MPEPVKKLTHLPECRAVNVDDMAREQGGPPAPAELSRDIYFMDCHPECPVLAEGIRRGQVLAKERGW